MSDPKASSGVDQFILSDCAVIDIAAKSLRAIALLGQSIFYQVYYKREQFILHPRKFCNIDARYNDFISFYKKKKEISNVLLAEK